MAKITKQLLIGAAVLVIFIFLGIILFKLLSLAQINTEDFYAQEAFLVAFAGAFFAFLFVRIGDFFEKILKRRLKNHDALVKLEYESNSMMLDLQNQVFVINEFLKAIKDEEEENKPTICFNIFSEIQYSKNILLELSNIDMINETFNLFTDIDKQNDSIKTFNHVYRIFQDTFLSKKISPEDFINKTIEQKDTLLMFKKNAVRLENKIIHIVACIRVLLKSQTIPFLFLQKFFLENKRLSALQNEIMLEKEKLEAERHASFEKNKKEIEEILPADSYANK